MVVAAETQCSNSSKQHLYPGDNWHGLPDDSVSNNCDLSNLAMKTFRDVELEIDTEDDLNDEHQHQPVCKDGVYVVREFPPFMQVSHEICRHRNSCSDDLSRYVPSIPDHLGMLERQWKGWEMYTKNHSSWEDDAEGKHHQENMYP